MKKALLTTLLTTIVAFSLIGCGNTNASTSSGINNTESLGVSYGYGVNFSENTEIEEGKFNSISENVSYSQYYNGN